MCTRQACKIGSTRECRSQVRELVCVVERKRRELCAHAATESIFIVRVVCDWFARVKRESVTDLSQICDRSVTDLSQICDRFRFWTGFPFRCLLYWPSRHILVGLLDGRVAS